jgi:hypothetical protein
MVQSPGIFRPGLDQADYTTAIADPNTITIPATSIPLATPLSNNHWFRQEYFDKHLGDGHDLFYYCGSLEVADQIGQTRDMVTDFLIGEVSSRGISLVFEQSDERDARPVFEGSLDRIGSVPHAFPLDTALADAKYQPIHHVFLTKYEGGAAGEIAPDMYDAYRKKYGHSGPTTVEEALDPSEIEQSYEHYVAAFRQVSDHDPIAATFTQEEYAAILTDPEYYKFVYRDGKGIANLCIANAIQKCDWINQDRMAEEFPDKYDAGLVLFCPGIFTRPDAAPGHSLDTLGLAAKVFEASGVEPAVVVECNDVSARYIPRILEVATKKAGVSTIHVGEPVVSQSVQVLTCA